MILVRPCAMAKARASSTAVAVLPAGVHAGARERAARDEGAELLGHEAVPLVVQREAGECGEDGVRPEVGGHHVLGFEVGEATVDPVEG